MIGHRINPPLAWGLAALALVVVTTAAALPGIARALFVSGDASDIQSDLERFVAMHEDEQETARARFDGRSAFFRPPPIRVERSAPERPAPKPVEPKPAPTPTGPPPPPASYSGPSIMAFVGDTVWFQQDLRISVGEEVDGVRVIAVDAPWSATLGYRGGEYEVPLFDRTDEKLFASAPTSGKLPGLIEVEPEAANEAANEESDEDGRSAG